MPDMGILRPSNLFDAKIMLLKKGYIWNFIAEDLLFLNRCNFNAYCLFSLVNTVVYCVPAHWIWSKDGFLYKMGAVDIAGSGGVHLVGGVSGKRSADNPGSINNLQHITSFHKVNLHSNFVFF